MYTSICERTCSRMCACVNTGMCNTVMYALAHFSSNFMTLCLNHLYKCNIILHWNILNFVSVPIFQNGTLHWHTHSFKWNAQMLGADNNLWRNCECDWMHEHVLNYIFYDILLENSRDCFNIWSINKTSFISIFIDIDGHHVK